MNRFSSFCFGLFANHQNAFVIFTNFLFFQQSDSDEDEENKQHQQQVTHSPAKPSKPPIKHPPPARPTKKPMPPSRPTAPARPNLSEKVC